MFGFLPIRSDPCGNARNLAYLVAHQLAQRNRLQRQQQFTFCGGAKNRGPKLADYVGTRVVSGRLDAAAAMSDSADEPPARLSIRPIISRALIGLDK